MRYVDCCKSTRKNKKCTRKDGKHFSLQRRFTKKKCIKGPVKGFTMRASCAPYKFCKQKGGARKTRKLLPKLRKISYKNKKHHYRLKDPFRKRKLAIHEGVNREAKKTGKTKKKAAIAKKGRFNILRIYRKNKKIKECNTITHDMRYMDRKYGLGKTKNICGQKGGTFPPDRPDSTFSNIDDLKFILSFYSPYNNNTVIIKDYSGEENEHQVKPEQTSDTHILIVGADHGIPFFLLQGGGFEIKPKGLDEYLTYVPPQQQGGRIPIEEKNFEEEEDPSTITIDEFEAQQQFLERERQEEVRRLRREQEENLRRRIEEGEINPYEPEFHLYDEVRVDSSNEDNGGILNNDEITQFNIQENQTVLDNIHYNPYSRWRVIHIEFSEDDLPEYTLQSVDNNNIQIIRSQPMLENLNDAQSRGGRRKKKTRKKRGGKLDKSILNEELQVCSKDPMTGFTRDGYCRINSNDSGSHLVCAKMDKQFLDYTKSKGNDLSSVVKDGENWCLCQDRWLQAHKVKKAPKVIKSATNNMIREDVKSAIVQKGGGFIKMFSIFNGEFPDPIGTDANGNQIKTLAWYGILVTPLKSGMAKMYMDQDFYNYFKWHPQKDEREYKRRVIKKILIALKNNLQQKNDKGVAYFGNNKFNIEQANFVLRHLKERNNVLKKIIAPRGQQNISRLSPIEEIEEKGHEDTAFSGGKRRRKTRKKRGGVERWRRETLQPNPETFDDIGYFYDCRPIDGVSQNKSKYRENMIITGDRDGNQLMLPHKLKIIRMDDSEFYDPQLQLVDMALPEGERGMRWFRRRAQQLCNRGYKPLKRNDAKTGAGRKKKTRKKRGGTNQCSICLKDEEIVDDDNHIRLSCGHIFCKNCIRSWLDINNTCPYCRSEVSENDRNRLNPGAITCDGCGETISQHDYDNGDYYRPGDGSLEGNEDHIFCTDCGQNWVCTYCNQVILRAERDRNEWVPIGQSDIACEDCAADNLSDSESEMDVEQGGGKRRKKKTRKKKKQFLYNPDDPSKSFDVYIDKNPNDTIPIKYTTVKDVKDTIKKLERLYKTKKYPHKRIWQVGMIMKVRLEAMLKHKTKKYPNAKKVKQRFNLANKYFKFLGKRTKKKNFKSRKGMTFKF